MHRRLEALEARTLMAFAGTFTDVDGDTYKIQLTGPGDAAVTTSMGGTTGYIDDLTITNTTAASTLKISLVSKAGDGRVELRNLLGTLVKSFDAKIVDLRDGGNVRLDDAASIAFGDVGTANFRVVTDSLPPMVNRSASFRDLKLGALLNFRGRLKTLSMRSAQESVVILGLGAGSIACTGDFIVSITTDQFGLIGPIGSIKVGGNARLNGIITGSVGSIAAQSFLVPNASNALLIEGSLGSLKSKAGNAGRWNANNFGAVSGTTFTGILESTLPDAKGFTFKSIKFTGAVTGGVIDTFDPQAAAGVDGVIGSLSVGSWSGGVIQAAAILSFKVTGNVQDLFVSLSGAPTGLTLGSMKVGGEVSGGSFTVRGSAGPITLASATNGNAPLFTDGNTTSAFKSITLTSKSVVISSLNVSVGSLGSFTCAHGLVVSQFNFDAASGLAIKTFKAAGQLQSVSINTPSTLGIDALSARGLFNSTWSLGFINTLKLGAEVNGASGGMNNDTLTLTGAGPQGFALKAMTSGDKMNGQINATALDARIGSVSVKYFGGGGLTASSFGSITATDKTTVSVTSIQATGVPLSGLSIGSLDFRGGLSGSEINAAGSIDKFSTLKFTSPFLTYITAGFASPIGGLPTDLNGYATASINQIKVTGAFGADPVFSSATFAADTIGKVTINGRTATAGSKDFGFVARHFGPFTLRLNTGVAASPVISTTPGDYNLLLPDSNGHFVVRVVA